MLNRLSLSIAFVVLASVVPTGLYAQGGLRYTVQVTQFENPDDSSYGEIAGDEKQASVKLILKNPATDSYSLLTADETPVKTSVNEDDTTSIEMEVMSYSGGRRKSQLLILVVPRIEPPTDDAEKPRRNNLGLFVLDIGTTDSDAGNDRGSDIIIESMRLNGLMTLKQDNADTSEYGGGWGNDLLNADDVMGEAESNVDQSDLNVWQANYGTTTSEVWISVGFFEVAG